MAVSHVPKVCQQLALEFLISVSCLEKSVSLHLLKSYKFDILLSMCIIC